MNVTCQQCKTKLNIPDHKLPKDKSATVACPKCRSKVQIPAARPATPAEPVAAKRLSFDERLNVLICVGDSDIRDETTQTVKGMGFEVEWVKDSNAAVSKMEYHVYHLVILDEAFDQGKGMSQVINKMNAMDMSLRRRICLVLINEKYATNDDMAALNISVNSILHTDDIIHLESFLGRAIMEHKNLYSVYNESMKLLGKA